MAKTAREWREQFPGEVVIRVIENGRTRILTVPDEHANKPTFFDGWLVKHFDGVTVTWGHPTPEGVVARPSHTYRRKDNE